MSPVVATVLIILVTIVAASLIAPFITNFVRSNLDDSGSCFDILGDLEFAQTEFNCVHDTAPRTGFSVQVNNEKIVGFKISLLQAGSSVVYEVTNGKYVDEVRMLQDPDFTTEPLIFPSDGGVRTYVANAAYEKAALFPIAESGNTCEESDRIDFIVCTGPNLDLVELP
jgi:hypothetical protein